MPRRNVDDLLDAVHIGGKGRDDDALVAAGKQLFKALSHPALRLGMSRALYVGAVRQQAQHALLAQLAEARDVGNAALHGRNVDLEVARLDHDAQRRVQRDSHSVGDGVVDVDQLHLHAPGTEALARLHGDDLHLLEQAELRQLDLHQPRSQAGGVDRRGQLLQHIRQRADVILMSVREHDSPDLFGVFLQVGDVRDDHVDAVHLLVRKAHTAVDHHNVTAVLIGRHVLADLAESAERNDFQF